MAQSDTRHVGVVSTSCARDAVPQSHHLLAAFFVCTKICPYCVISINANNYHDPIQFDQLNVCAPIRCLCCCLVDSPLARICVRVRVCLPKTYEYCTQTADHNANPFNSNPPPPSGPARLPTPTTVSPFRVTVIRDSEPAHATQKTCRSIIIF